MQTLSSQCVQVYRVQPDPPEIQDVKLLTPARHTDARGFFSEIYNVRALQEAGITLPFSQENYSHSTLAHTVRGLHFQKPPYAQAKLVQVVRGAIFDVAVDLRHGSPTFGQHVTALISAENWSQIYIPVGFAHGFCTLEPDTAVIYKVSAAYSPAHDAGVIWNDPDLAIAWPVSAGDAILSDKDRQLPALADCPACFAYDGNHTATP